MTLLSDIKSVLPANKANLLSLLCSNSRCMDSRERYKLERQWLVETGFIEEKPIIEHVDMNAKEWRAEYYRTHKEYSADKSLQRRRGITLEEKTNMYNSQNGKCAICEIDITLLGKSGSHVDHNHKTGQIRSLLCHKCNHLLGNATDDPSILEKAIEYLFYWNSQT